MNYPPRQIRIHRPQQSAYTQPVSGWLYFDGPLSKLKHQTKIVLDIPGGGFVAMNPRCNDDKLMAWAGKGLPVLSLDYRKAPENPYPYALHECYDVYRSIIASRGRCIGFAGNTCPSIIVSGDSAGGNLAAGVTLMVLASGGTDIESPRLPRPEGLLLQYPGLDLNIGSWMTDEQMALMRMKSMRKSTEPLVRRKSNVYDILAAKETLSPDTSSGESTPQEPEIRIAGYDFQGQDASDMAHLVSEVPASQSSSTSHTTKTAPQRSSLKTNLAMCSMISFTNDRILTPEMMRAMIILYVGPDQRPNFRTDYLLSPLLAPDTLLADFPPTFFITGERDPLVDDTVLFAGRIKQAKCKKFSHSQHTGPEYSRDTVEVHLIPGVSHGFFQMVQLYPEAKKYIDKSAHWMSEVFHHSVRKASSQQQILGTSALPGWEIFNKEVNNGTLFVEKERNSDIDQETPTSTSEDSDDECGPLVERAIGEGHRPPVRRDRLVKTENDIRDVSTAGDKQAFMSMDCKKSQPLKSDEWKPARRRSMSSLADADDLMSRRMEVVAGGLMGA